MTKKPWHQQRRIAPAAERMYRGVVYHSKAEMSRAPELDLLMKGNVITGWSRQPQFTLGIPEIVYTADYIVADRDFRWVEDVKGYATPMFNLHKRLWKVYGTLPLRILWCGSVPLKRRMKHNMVVVGRWTVETVPGGKQE